MSASIYRRCGCRDEGGRQFGVLPDGATAEQRARACPRLVSDPKHGSWGYYLSAGVNPATGRRQQARRAGFPTKTAAQKARNAEAVKIDQGRWLPPTRDTLADYLAKWLPRHRRTARNGQGLRDTTFGQYQRYIENDIASTQLGRMRISDIRRHHVVAYFDQLAEDGRGVSTRHKILVVLQAGFSSALLDEMVDINPALRIPLEAEQPKRFEAWTPDQVGEFLDVAVKHRLGALYELAFLTGMRRGELVGLRWEAVDLPSRTLRVEHTRVQAASGIVDSQPKTDSGRRTVTLDDAAIGALLSWQLRQDGERSAWAEAWHETGYVFTMEDGTPVKPDYATRLFEKLRQQTNSARSTDNAKRRANGEPELPLLPHTTLHGARHEHASLWIAGGGDVTLLSKRLGHSTSRITADLYVSRVGDADRAQAERVAGMIPRAASHTVHTSGP